jgi:hypothetical protein
MTTGRIALLLRRCAPGVAAAVLGACGSDATSILVSAGSVASYSSANAFLPIGYSDTKLEASHYTVRAMGTETTPRDRVELIARTRAAEIGVADKTPYFKVLSVTPSFACGKKVESYKGPAPKPLSGPVVSLDVVYAKTAGDPAYADAAQSFAELKARLDGEQVPAEARLAASAEVKAACGR